MLTALGINTPDDKGKYVATETRIKNGTVIYDVYKSTSGFGYIVGAYRGDESVTEWFFSDGYRNGTYLNG